ncbi:MAG: hypothetical protein CMH27_06255 [Micavibrio sp.]|nr:hypothetical protein [Micavibrio sp.]|tara:strand:- start:682 stop:1293 length:612 start_codon:yes stop_codon:yes gene_type:complete
MLEWIETHNAALSVLISFAMLIVWVLYLQFFLMTYVRQRRSKIIINKVAGSSHKSHCFISNMSAETIYISVIKVTLQNPDDEWIAYITDFEEVSDSSDKRPAEMTYQGPMGTGAFYDLGSYESIVSSVQKRTEAPKDILKQDDFSMEIKVLGFYGSERLPVAAYRNFTYDKGEMRPATPQTFQVRSLFKRKQIANELANFYTS